MLLVIPLLRLRLQRCHQTFVVGLLSIIILLSALDLVNGQIVVTRTFITVITMSGTQPISAPVQTGSQTTTASNVITESMSSILSDNTPSFSSSSPTLTPPLQSRPEFTTLVTPIILTQTITTTETLDPSTITVTSFSNVPATNPQSPSSSSSLSTISSITNSSSLQNDTQQDDPSSSQRRWVSTGSMVTMLVASLVAVYTLLW